jgi:hypothetical protein
LSHWQSPYTSRYCTSRMRGNAGRALDVTCASRTNHAPQMHVPAVPVTHAHRYASYDATPAGIETMAKSIAAFGHRTTPSHDDEGAAKRSSTVQLTGLAEALSKALIECRRVASGGVRRPTPTRHRLPVTVADDGFFVDADGRDVFPTGYELLSVPPAWGRCPLRVILLLPHACDVAPCVPSMLCCTTKQHTAKRCPHHCKIPRSSRKIQLTATHQRYIQRCEGLALISLWS